MDLEESTKTPDGLSRRLAALKPDSKIAFVRSIQGEVAAARARGASWESILKEINKGRTPEEHLSMATLKSTMQRLKQSTATSPGTPHCPHCDASLMVECQDAAAEPVTAQNNAIEADPAGAGSKRESPVKYFSQMATAMNK